MATAALGALGSIAASYGSGNPLPSAGQSFIPPNLAATQMPSGPIVWDGHMNSGYSTAAGTASRAADAMGDLNAELEQLLSEAAGTTVRGRAELAAIIADADASVTALGNVPDSAAGHQLLINTLDAALQRAGVVVGHGQSATRLTAARISALADRYLRESRYQPAVGASGFESGPPLARPSGTEAQWIGSALGLLAQNGYDVSHIDPADIAAIVQHESGGNPNAINGWDSNAAAGHPSKGLMQTIDSTFYAHALPGHTNIWNPVDNIVAGVRYAIARYGSLDNVPGIIRLHEGRSYIGY
ncbi:transglycosylase SLT domain-containing protein [Nocardia sp. NEAU-G5]|uniref:Transglycosylase SLT domain-containing protein n=1 Tax=Nocardia albiluteola TaxID=2842303 RepID=A0ABS6B926_9NOCA|nr:transglycosylase SLT domain-containing protein [Nocardia albiluteola]MBU3066807.1 transglycosylase SLT domain-containing protein [Nocardia albiluteola]